ncbi:sporulation protein YqfD [Edaphobacillus lindanitolerans]|uniref:Similar to stage IV sporulation protein n=1 Tax=Edaphobacillus lindanitolerans TaxID=550447 RepID=A0A1U7PMG0_9BACI|nr:sporulation protein YqfD [Edaphobacillus lindanitolerans]SIT82344.1 similar to stage IV sporulation protein [Edaphobacillus lindanitolerans]
MRTDVLRRPGRILVEVRGDHADAFLSDAAARGIGVRNVRREEEVLLFSARKADMPALRKLRRRHRVRLRLFGESGHMERFLSWQSLSGFVLFLLPPLILSMFIWTVDVAGGVPEREERISEWLGKQGMTAPMRMGQVPDEGKIRNALMSADPGLAWVRVELRGGRLTVHAIEAPKAGTGSGQKEAPAHLAASRRAVVTRFELTSGVRNVLPNTTVEKGDILASGIVTQGDKSVMTGAEGKVYGDYFQEMHFSIPARVRYSQLNGREFKIALGESREKSADGNWRQLRLPRPLSGMLSIGETSAVRQRSFQLEEENGEELILGILREKLRRSLTPGAKVKDEKILRVDYDNDKVEGTILFLINENIAVRKQVAQGD